jgi:protein-L-isoaspartate(D-aspartate) O-methyltransferase
VGEEALAELTERWADQLDRLERGGRLERADVRAAMERHPRFAFLGPAPSAKQLEAAVADRPVPLGDGQTISAPHMVAILVEASRARPGDRCLEVGSGSGWLVAVLADVVGPKGVVTGVEIEPSLVEASRGSLERAGVGNAEVLLGDGGLGHPEGGPYDVIVVSAAPPEVPDPLVDQLGEGGHLVVPVGRRGHQKLKRITRAVEGPEVEDLGGCAFVPLVGEHGH